MKSFINAFPECPKCGENIFSKGSLSFTFEAINGAYFDEGFFETTLSFDNSIDLKVDYNVFENHILKFEEQLNEHLPHFDVLTDNINILEEPTWEEDNLIEYIYTCPHCDEKISTYNDDPNTFFAPNTLEERLSDGKSVYDLKIHKEVKISLCLSELIENTRYDLKGKFFKVICMFLAYNSSFKHRGGAQEKEAFSECDMEECNSDDGIEHGVHGIDRAIIYISIEVSQH